MKVKTLPIFFAFFVMGFVDSVGTLVGFAREQFQLSPSVAGLLPLFGLVAFAIFSVPAGILADKKGKKFLLLLSLAIVFLGELTAAIKLSNYGILLFAIFLIGVGMAVLQVAGNPIMRDVSEEGRYARNLTFAQFIKSIGSNSAPYAIPFVIFIGFEWNFIFSIYAVVAFGTIIGVYFLKVKEEKRLVDKPPASLKSSFGLLKDPAVFLMVLGIFLYVGAEVGMNSWIATHLSGTFGFDIEKYATLGIGLFLTALAIGRLLGSMVLHFIPATRFFVLTAVLSLIGVLGMFALNVNIVLISIFVAGLGFGNIFPLIFSLLIDSRPEHSSELSGLLCMAIVGGAIMPFFMGLIADDSVRSSFIVPFLSIGFVLFLSIKFYFQTPGYKKA